MKPGDPFVPEEILQQFDDFLAKKKVTYTAILIGSGAMNILGILKSVTTDFDVLDPKIPEKILNLAEEFRIQMEAKGVKLNPNWINNGPASLLNHLPVDWMKRITPLYKGRSITFSTLGRPEILMDKLWGYCDLRNADREVILNLKPTKKELETASDWLKKQEANPGWPSHVDEKVNELQKELQNEE